MDYKFVNKSQLLTLLFGITYLPISMAQVDQDSGQLPIAIKINTIPLFYEDVSFEVEWEVNNQTSFFGGLGYTQPYWFRGTSFTNKKWADVNGFGSRFGTKYYIFKPDEKNNLSGLSIKSQIIVQYYQRDENKISSISLIKKSQLSAGVYFGLSYQYNLINKVPIEAEIGAGHAFSYVRYVEITAPDPNVSNPKSYESGIWGMFGLSVGYLFNLKTNK